MTEKIMFIVAWGALAAVGGLLIQQASPDSSGPFLYGMSAGIILTHLIRWSAERLKAKQKRDKV